MTVKKGNRYLVERSNKAHGGGFFELKINNILQKHIQVDGNWHTLVSFNERYNILEEIPEDDD